MDKLAAEKMLRRCATVVTWAIFLWVAYGFLHHDGRFRVHRGVAPVSGSMGTEKNSDAESGGVTAGAAIPRDEFGNTLLHLAIYNGDLQEAENQRAAGVPVDARNADGLTPLAVAADRADAAAAAWLLDHGADVNARSKAGFTPVHYAVQHDILPVVKLLIARGADLSVRGKEDGLTPRQRAAIKGNKAVYDVLAAEEAP